jgi:hypothetical protein
LNFRSSPFKSELLPFLWETILMILIIKKCKDNLFEAYFPLHCFRFFHVAVCLIDWLINW